MNAIEIRGLVKAFKQKQAVCGLNMTVPQGAIYGLIGENGSGKSTTEKIICGLMHPDDGTVRLFGQPLSDDRVRAGLGVLIEAPGCFPNLTVWDNMKLQAANLGLKRSDAAIMRILKTVRMEGAASNRYKNCSLGMKQRIGLAMALLGNPKLLVLDEPINGLDADGMRIMREVLCELAAGGVTILISSHILGELEKIATHYGIIRRGRLLREMTAAELEDDCPTYTALQAQDMVRARAILSGHFARVEQDEGGFLRVYDSVSPEDVVRLLYENNIVVSELETRKVNLEEFYLGWMKEEQ